VGTGVTARNEPSRTTPKLIVVLSENWTLISPRDLPGLVRMAVQAEAAGADAVMVSEHLVLGSDADAQGRPMNPREYALPGNQAPSTPWPSSLLILSAIAAATSSLRLLASAVIPPLRHPLHLAKELATLDLLSTGRLVVQPTVSWHRSEYQALGVDFGARGELLDEHLAAWDVLWRETPASFEGRNYRFSDVYFEPKPFRPSGPVLWFGGTSLHDKLLRRIVRYGQGFNPLGRPTPEELQRLALAMAEAGRNLEELELVGGTRAVFPSADSVADLDLALESIPAQMSQGFTSFCLKPSQFTDDPAQVEPMCRKVVKRLAEFAA
jgi:probable F420-dependent oxidoreductase